jgi:hypothetical protein
MTVLATASAATPIRLTGVFGVSLKQMIRLVQGTLVPVAVAGGAGRFACLVNYLSEIL